MFTILNYGVVDTYKYSIIILLTGLIFLIISLFLHDTLRNISAWIGAFAVLIGVSLFTYLYWSRKYQQKTITENNFIQNINSYIK